MHLLKAIECGSSETYTSVFRPVKPVTDDGPRIWIEQLLSYAAYEDGEGVTGDPTNVRQYSVSIGIIICCTTLLMN